MSCNELLLPSIRSVFFEVIANASNCCFGCVNITSCETVPSSAHALRTSSSDFIYNIYYPDLLLLPPPSDLNPSLDQISVAFSSSLFSYAQQVNSSTLVTVSRSVTFGLAHISSTSIYPTYAPSVSAHVLGSSASAYTPNSIVAGVVVGSVIFSAIFVCAFVVMRRMYSSSRTVDASTYAEIDTRPNAE